jgi:Domain of unknown function (DUF4845)
MKTRQSNLLPQQLFLKRQSGLTFLSFMVVGAVVIFFFVLGMKVAPTYLEFTSIQKASARALNEGGETPIEIRRKFDALASVDYITSITGADLDISKDNSNRVVVNFKYEKKIPLIGPASLVMDYEGSAKKKDGGP